MAPFEYVDTRHASRGAFEEKDMWRDGVKARDMDNHQHDERRRDGENHGNGNRGGQNDGSNEESMGGRHDDGFEIKDDNDPTKQGNAPPPNSYSAPQINSSPTNYPTQGGRSSVAASPTTVIFITTADAMTMTVVVTTTASSSISSMSSSPFASDALSSISSSPIAALAVPASISLSSSSLVQTVTVYAALPDASNQPRKGLDVPSTITVWTSATFAAESALSDPSTTSPTDSNDSHYSSNQNKSHDQISPMAEDFLIAAGAIGAFIMVASAIWFFARMHKIDLLASFRSNKGGHGGNQQTYYTEPPPQYAGVYANEKAMMAQRSQPVENSYPSTKMAMPTPARTNSQRSDLSNGRMMDAPPAFTQTMAPAQQVPVVQTFYNEPTLSRQGTQTTQVSAAHSGYNTTGTQQTFQTLGVYDPNQREVNRLSFLSSLSSGFGDGLIIPVPTVVGANGTRKSYADARKFSWMTAQDGTRLDTTGNRDTVCTTASDETAPRFRTVNSWVAQQSGRVGRQEQSDSEPPNMPPIPHSQQNSNISLHSRNQSEDPAFRHHPGDELSLGRGSRAPSSILDRKVNVNSR